MPSVIGPILTVGVALGAAAVVVANPVIAPRADLRIPAVNLSTNSTGNDALAMLDEDFLAAIAPTPTASSTHPFAILKDLVNGIVADAAYLGETAIVQAFVTGATVIADPELTATWQPYIPAGSSQWPQGGSVLPAPSAPDWGAIDVALDPEALAAAFAAGAVLASEQWELFDTLRGVVEDKLKRVLDTALDTAAAVWSLVPHPTIADTILSVIGRNLAAIPAALESAAAAIFGRDNLPTPTIPKLAGPPVASATAATPEETKPRRQRSVLLLETPVLLPLPAASDLEPAQRDEPTSDAPTRLSVSRDSDAGIPTPSGPSRLGRDSGAERAAGTSRTERARAHRTGG